MSAQPPDNPIPDTSAPASGYPPPPGYVLISAPGEPLEWAAPPGYGQGASYAPAGFVPASAGAFPARPSAPSTSQTSLDSGAHMARWGWILAIVALLLSGVPSCGALFMVLSLLISLIGLSSRRRRGEAIFGVVLTVVAIIVAIFVSPRF
ncbi:MAG TPA: hypothetical protein VF808_20310 [Ktedonobacterales bacterium]